MYHIRDNYIGRAFTWTPISILSGLLLFFAATIYGQILFATGSMVSEWIGVSDYYSGLYVGFIPFALAALAGVGLIFILADVWLIYELLYEEGVGSRFFFWIAANQIGICTCASIPAGEFFQVLFPTAIALSALVLVARILTWISRSVFRL